MDYLKGKRLLIMGGIQKACEIVEKAHELGIYVMVTDYIEDSPAKKIADESFMVSTTDVDAVVDLCKEKKVDGVFTSFIDSMLPYCCEVCERLGLPFYATKEQLDICNDKSKFKDMCTDNGLLTASTINVNKNFTYSDLKNIEFPVIIKPVDNGGGKGITICNSELELIEAHEKAMLFSKRKEIILEKYLQGNEISVCYTLKDGQISLSCIFDKFMNHAQYGMAPLPNVNIYPSKFIDIYMDFVNDKVIAMLRNLGLKNGVIFIQNIINEDGIFFIEMGCRMNGSCDYHYINYINGIDIMKMSISHALTGEMGIYDLKLDNPRFKKYCATLHLCSKGGTINEIVGIEEVKVKLLDSLIHFQCNYKVGDYIEKSGTLNQILFTFYMVDNSIKNICKTIELIQNTVKVFDQYGYNMLYNNFDINVLTNTYK